MSSLRAPLLDLFYELQQRNFPLGTSEYVTALTALSVGNGITTRQDLIFMCQLVWAKSVEEQKQVAEALTSLLPRELTEDQLAALGAGPIATEVPPSATAPALEEKPLSQPSQDAAPIPTETEKHSDQTRTPPSGEENLDLNFRPSESMTGESLPVSTSQATWHLNPHLDFVGSLPVSKRQMKRAWRYYRRMRRIGPPAELDVQATVEEIYQHGIFLKPVLIPRRQNQARILVLIDEQGSMVPFRRITHTLLDSLNQNGLARASILFFHDAPADRLFHDLWLNRSELTARVLRFFSDAGVLIVSDGGAARGNYDQNRLTQTKKFIAEVRSYTPNIAWINPMPQERWPGTTAGAIVKECAMPMFGLDRAGLDAAVSVMKGKGR